MTFLLGITAAGGFAPVGITALFMIGFVLALRSLAHVSTLRQAFWRGWWFGFGLFSAGLYWIAAALFVDIEAYWFLVPLAVFGIPAVLALYVGLVFMGIHKFGRSPFQSVCLAIFLWMLVELFRGQVFLPFPWLLAGYAWQGVPMFEQLAAVIGVYGLSFVMIWLCGSIAFRSMRALVPAIIILLGGSIWGYDRLQQPAVYTDQYLRIVQPNIAQKDKWNPDKKRHIWQTYMDLSSQPAQHDLSAIIWPEAALPWPVDRDQQALNALSLLPAPLIMGNTRWVSSKALANSLLVIDNNQIQDIYDKHILVPFGEYVPFGLPNLVSGGLEFRAGQGAETLSLGDISFSPLICYEAIFSGQTTAGNRPDMMINITNDAWYGYTSGPFQHLNMTRLRAIEEGVPLFRAANTGVSAVVDSYGRVVRRLPLQQAGIIDMAIPAALFPTVFSRLQPLQPAYILLLICGFLLLISGFLKKQ